jgi:uncharacterized protein YegJ (DUF2314 family)
MPQESSANWGYVCDRHTPRADPRFVLVPAACFVGRYVKCAFKDRDHPRYEHMWVEVRLVTLEGDLVGALNNDPVYNVGLSDGDLVVVKREAIEAVLPPLGH